MATCWKCGAAVLREGLCWSCRSPVTSKGWVPPPPGWSPITHTDPDAWRGISKEGMSGPFGEPVDSKPEPPPGKS